MADYCQIQIGQRRDIEWDTSTEVRHKCDEPAKINLNQSLDIAFTRAHMTISVVLF
jgi:hypothetical protein